MSDQYSTGVYVKGDSEKVANTAARAVALVFDGYRLKTESTESEAPKAEPVTSTAPVRDTPAPVQSPLALSAAPEKENPTP